MDLVPEWAPNVHPMFVHFPIGLLITAACLDALALLPKMHVVRRAVPVIYAAGAVAAIATYFTGQAAADGVSMPPAAEPILTTHADFALWTVLFFSTYAVVRLLVARLLPGVHIVVRFLLVLLAAFGIYLLWETGERGSEMVYAHGVGVRAVQDEEVLGDTAGATGTLEIGEDGWTLRPTSAEALSHVRIRWLVGALESLRVDESSEGVALRSSGGTVMFVVDDTLESVQLTAELDASDFSGSVSLVHHVQSAATYDYLAVTGGEMRLGRFEGGSERRLDADSMERTGWIRLRATGDGTHYRGYIDDEMVVHGHTDALPAGTAGLRLDGQGTIRLRRLQARRL